MLLGEDGNTWNAVTMKHLLPVTTLSIVIPTSSHPLVIPKPKRRDLRFYGPFVEIFFDRAG